MFSDLLWMAALIPVAILVFGCAALLLDRRSEEPAPERQSDPGS